MSLYDRDYLMRQIRQLAEVIRRLVEGAKGQPTAELSDAKRMLDQQGHGLVGPLFRTLIDADTATTLMLVNDADKLFALAAILRQHALLLGLEGNAARATIATQRSMELLLEITERANSTSQAVLDELALVATQVDVARLAPRYQRILQRVTQTTE